MPIFPDEIYNQRDTENLPGIVFNPADKKNFYAEDFQGLGDEIVAVENYLGLCKKFICLLNQQGNDPPVPIILNSQMEEITWSYQGDGQYGATKQSKFDETKCVFILGSLDKIEKRKNFNFRIENGDIIFYTYNESGQQQNGQLAYTPLIILEYA